jgi:hypothetical protein
MYVIQTDMKNLKEKANVQRHAAKSEARSLKLE